MDPAGQEGRKEGRKERKSKEDITIICYCPHLFIQPFAAARGLNCFACRIAIKNALCRKTEIFNGDARCPDMIVL
jgi:hypothetical protein